MIIRLGLVQNYLVPQGCYNNEVFADTTAGRKALLKKVEDEVAAGRVNVSDKDAVKNDILKGEPTEANGKLQYGDIERMVFFA